MTSLRQDQLQKYSDSKEVLEILTVIWSLLPSEFVGTVNGKDNYRTGVTPTVKLFTNDTLVELESQTKNADGSTSAEIIIPAGKNRNEKLVLGFRFKIAGDSQIPAGNYTSNVIFTYTYDW